MSQPDISRILTISTGHVTENTRNMLDREPEEDNFGLAVYNKNDFGYIIYLPDPSDNNEIRTIYTEIPSEGPYFGYADKVPKDLQDVLRYCHDMGCDILCLDSDGPEIPYLRWYDEDEVYEHPDDPRQVPICKTDLPISLGRPLAGYYGDWCPIGQALADSDEAIHENTALAYRQIASIRRYYRDSVEKGADGNGEP